MSNEELYSLSWAWIDDDKSYSLIGTKSSCEKLFEIFEMGQNYGSLAFFRITVAASGCPVREFVLDPTASTGGGLEGSWSRPADPRDKWIADAKAALIGAIPEKKTLEMIFGMLASASGHFPCPNDEVRAKKFRGELE